MGRDTKFGRTWKAAVLVAAGMLVAGSGCNPATTLWFLNRGDGKQAPTSPLEAKEGKDEVTVALLMTASPTLSVEFAGVDRELGTLLSRRLEVETKDVKKPLKPIKVLPLSKVDKYKASNPNWKVSSPGHIAKGLGADYLIDINIDAMSLYSPEYGREACKGSATLQVAVYDAEDPERVKYQYPLSFNPPISGAGLTAPVQYRKEFLDRLALTLAWKHAPHVSEMEIGSRLR